MSNNDNQETKSTDSTSAESHPARHGGLSYLQIPAVHVQQSAVFYERVFGWSIRGRDTDHPRFDDGGGYISGAWVTDLAISREPGLLPYILVDAIDETMEQIKAQGGEIVKAPFPKETCGSRPSVIPLAMCSASSSKALAEPSPRDKIGGHPRQCSPQSVVRKRQSMRPLPLGRDRDGTMQDPVVEGHCLLLTQRLSASAVRLQHSSSRSTSSQVQGQNQDS